jgi:hypothetical protein
MADDRRVNDSSAMLSDAMPAAEIPVEPKAGPAPIGPAVTAPEETTVQPVVAPDEALAPSRFQPGPLPDLARAARSEQVFRWFNRPRRVLLTLALVWVISVFDLGFTLLESNSGYFVELNPVAERLLSGPVYTLAAFKFGLTGLGTIILLCLRRHSTAEWACWFLLAVKVYVAIRWFAYFDALAHGHDSPLLQVH